MNNTIIKLLAAACVSLVVSSCLWDNADKTQEVLSGDHNLSLSLNTRAGSYPYLVSNMRLFTFHNGGPTDRMFNNEVMNIVRTEDQLSALVDKGDWHMALVSPPDLVELLPPGGSVVMEKLPMYKYTTSIDPLTARSTSAPEIYLANEILPKIQANGQYTIGTRLNRNVAQVEIILHKLTANFATAAQDHTVRLHNVPSTISYTGAILPSRTAPDTLPSPLEAKVELENHPTQTGFLHATDTIRFIIPAHRGSDYTDSNPEDTITLNMALSVDLLRAGSSRFRECREIELVAKCNKILRVDVEINDGMEFHTSILDWEDVNLSGVLGDGYNNWLYVSKGVRGSGQSWRDALPTIADAIRKAETLTAASYPVNGILVAGGPGRVYEEEGFTVPAGIRIFGGWDGVSGTELSPSDLTGPYTSDARDLASCKAVMSITDGGIVLGDDDAVLDGFILRAGSSPAQGILKVENEKAWVNAIEIDGQDTGSGYVLEMNGGRATNILVSRNTGGVSLTGGARLVNATVAENGSPSFCENSSLLNSVIWGSEGRFTFSGTNTTEYCSFLGTYDDIPEGTANIPVSLTNDQWFSPSILIPGPHFNLGLEPGRPRYMAGTVNPNRAPMLGRGDQDYFDGATPEIPDGYKTDIDGNPRHANRTDMGCYEDSEVAGFRLEWASDRLYVSSKENYMSEIPLMLPANEQLGITIEWEAQVVKNADGPSSTLSHCTFNGPHSGSGTGIIVGRIELTTTALYEDNSERYLGSILVTTPTIGSYLVAEEIEVWQTPGSPSVWNDGYVGSFHRNNQRGARYIHAVNSGDWTVRIISGLDWIKIDGHERDYGESIIGEVNDARNDQDYHKEVEEAVGGVVSGSGYIKFRVGLKSENPNPEPRYGLITIIRQGGVAMFFVRQGEEADYLYRPQDPRTQARTQAKKWANFSVSDPNKHRDNIVRGNEAAYRLPKNGGVFTDYPSQIGYFFQWNRMVPYLRGAQISSLQNDTHTRWDTEREICPPGYRHASFQEIIHSLYQNVSVSGTGTHVDPTGREVTRNFVWGRLADGWYDQLAPDPIEETPGTTSGAITSGVGFDVVGEGPGVAMRGILMVNHFNYASVFFPLSSTMLYTSPTGFGQTFQVTASVNPRLVWSTTCMFHHTNNYYDGTHWLAGHVGMGCTDIATWAGTPSRCVRDD